MSLQDMKFGWKIIVGSIIGFLGAAFGSVGGVGGGGIFVPMLSLIVGFDPKSSTAISKCKIGSISITLTFKEIVCSFHIFNGTNSSVYLFCEVKILC